MVSEGKSLTGISKTTFIVGILISILTSTVISALVITQTDLAKGPKGETGATGPQGITGPQGTTGPAGEDGREVVFAHWNVTWRTLSGDLEWGGDVGTSEFFGTFDYDWGTGTIFAGHDDYIGFGATMEVKMQRDGPVTFTVGSDDSSDLYIDDVRRINNWGIHLYQTKSITIDLSEGTHNLTLYYLDKTGSARVSFDCDFDILMWYEG